MKDSAARRRLERFALQAAARELLPDMRVADCMRFPVPGEKIRVCYSHKVSKSHYKGLTVCGMVWVDPVCSSKITERRRQELETAIASNPQYKIALVTFTVQHNRGDDCRELLRDLLQAYRRLKSGRWWIGFEKQFGIVGSIRSLETTYGVNGWHHHFHALFVANRKIDADEVQDELVTRWRSVLDEQDRTATYAHGVDVRTANKDVVKYVEKYGEQPVDFTPKWTIEHELTKGAAKKAKDEKGRTPFQLLADYMNGDKNAGALFKQYVLAFKGKQQLVWSKGLRDLLGVGEEKTDEQLAVEQSEDAVVLAELTRIQWRVILARDKRGQLLEVANSGNAEYVQSYLRSIGADVESAEETVRKEQLTGTLKTKRRVSE